jgi:hypothetical protein
VLPQFLFPLAVRGRRGDRMVIGFTTTCAISAYQPTGHPNIFLQYIFSLRIFQAILVF